MDFFKKLIILNNENDIKKIAEDIYLIDDEDDDEETQFVIELREKFLKKYNKKNNQLFKLTKD